MKKYLILVLLMALVGGVFSSMAEEPRRDDGMFNTYVIRNAQLTPAVAEKFNFILPMDLAKTGYPDSYYTFLLPGTGDIIAINKTDLIKDLFPGVNKWQVNGKPVSDEEFYATPGQMLTLVEFKDGVLMAETRENVNDDNPYEKQAVKDSMNWFQQNLGTPMPSEVVINDPETYFENPNTIVTLDYIITSPDKVKQADVKGYVMMMVGTNPVVYALTDSKDINYFGFDGEMEAEVSAINAPLTPANIATYFNRPVEDLMLIRTDGETVKANVNNFKYVK